MKTFHFLFVNIRLYTNYQTIYMVVLQFSGPLHQDKMSRHRLRILAVAITVWGVMVTVKVLDRGGITGGFLLSAWEVADLTEHKYM